MADTHVIVAAPGHYFDSQLAERGLADTIAEELFHDTRVIGPFATRGDACEYADQQLDGSSWRVDSIVAPRSTREA